MNSVQNKRVAGLVYSLLVERLEELDDSDRNLNDKLASILDAAKEQILSLRQQQSMVELVKAVFRGFSLHRQLERVLAEAKIQPSSDTHKWADKCLEMLRTGAVAMAQAKEPSVPDVKEPEEPPEAERRSKNCKLSPTRVQEPALLPGHHGGVADQGAAR